MSAEDAVVSIVAPEGSILTITNYGIEPNPPVPGSDVTLTIDGNLSGQLTATSIVSYRLTYGNIKLASGAEELVRFVDELPDGPGAVSMPVVISLADAVPPGSYRLAGELRNGDELLVLTFGIDVKF